MEGDKIKVLPGCDHGFHPECVDEWLRARANCPLCRASLVRASVAKEQEAMP
ncbi:RING-H2 finger protein [Musa troglodytarum]|nr:RING-H2 finger protein [Musa troglodytarum]